MPKMINFWCLSADKKSTSNPSLIPGDIAKILQPRYFAYLNMPGYAHPKWYYQIVENF